MSIRIGIVTMEIILISAVIILVLVSGLMMFRCGVSTRNVDTSPNVTCTCGGVDGGHEPGCGLKIISDILSS